MRTCSGSPAIFLCSRGRQGALPGALLPGVTALSVQFPAGRQPLGPGARSAPSLTASPTAARARTRPPRPGAPFRDALRAARSPCSRLRLLTASGALPGVSRVLASCGRPLSSGSRRSGLTRFPFAITASHVLEKPPNPCGHKRLFWTQPHGLSSSGSFASLHSPGCQGRVFGGRPRERSGPPLASCPSARPARHVRGHLWPTAGVPVCVCGGAVPDTQSCPRCRSLCIRRQCPEGPCPVGNAVSPDGLLALVLLPWSASDSASDSAPDSAPQGSNTETLRVSSRLREELVPAQSFRQQNKTLLHLLTSSRTSPV